MFDILASVAGSIIGALFLHQPWRIKVKLWFGQVYIPRVGFIGSCGYILNKHSHPVRNIYKRHRRLGRGSEVRLESIDVSISDELIEDAVRFHGHLGPFLVLGVKAGLLANAVLGKNHFRTRAIVITDPSPPHSCFADGVQFVTGCTMGKRNIKLMKGDGVSVLFLKEGKRLRLRLKNEVLNFARGVPFGEESRRAALSLLDKSIPELFEVEG